MYTREQRIQSQETELSNYIQEFDVYNSLFLQKISDPSLERNTYEITVYEYRPDLIALDFYGDAEYMGILMIQVKVSLTNLKRGVILKLLPKDTIDKIISDL